MLAHLADDDFGNVGQEGLGKAGHPPVPGSPAQDEAQHVTPPLVARHHPVADHKGDRPSVVGDDPVGYQVLFTLSIAVAQ